MVGADWLCTATRLNVCLFFFLNNQPILNIPQCILFYVKFPGVRGYRLGFQISFDEYFMLTCDFWIKKNIKGARDSDTFWFVYLTHFNLLPILCQAGCFRF